jgi:hypothetical protein
MDRFLILTRTDLAATFKEAWSIVTIGYFVVNFPIYSIRSYLSGVRGGHGLLELRSGDRAIEAKILELKAKVQDSRRLPI